MGAPVVVFWCESFSFFLRSLFLTPVVTAGSRRPGVVDSSVLDLPPHNLCTGDDPAPSEGIFLNPIDKSQYQLPWTSS